MFRRGRGPDLVPISSAGSSPAERAPQGTEQRSKKKWNEPDKADSVTKMERVRIFLKNAKLCLG